MATIRLANRTGQAGTYYTGSPNYVDVDNTEAALTDMVTFAVKAAADGWDDGDLVGVFVFKSAGNWKVWTGTWDAANEYVELETEELTVGSISNTDTVDVWCVPTQGILDRLMRTPQYATISGTTHALLADDTGKVHLCTNGSAVTVTLDEDMPVGWQGLFIQQGAGTVSFAREGTDTINGAASNVSITGQWKSAFVCQTSAGAWTVVV